MNSGVKKKQRNFNPTAMLDSLYSSNRILNILTFTQFGLVKTSLSADNIALKKEKVKKH